MTPKAFQRFALSLPDAHEEPHFEQTSFRIGQKIVATMTPDGEEAMVRFGDADLLRGSHGARLRAMPARRHRAKAGRVARGRMTVRAIVRVLQEGFAMKKNAEKKPSIIAVAKASPTGVRVRTSIKAGDVYMQHPRGSNDRLSP